MASVYYREPRQRNTKYEMKKGQTIELANSPRWSEYNEHKDLEAIGMFGAKAIGRVLVTGELVEMVGVEIV